MLTTCQHAFYSQKFIRLTLQIYSTGTVSHMAAKVAFRPSDNNFKNLSSSIDVTKCETLGAPLSMLPTQSVTRLVIGQIHLCPRCVITYNLIGPFTNTLISLNHPSDILLQTY